MKLSKKISLSGFTLIELLVVLVIIGVVMSLAAPPLVRTIESSQARNEEIRLISRLKVYSSKAFVNESNVVLNFHGKTLDVHMASKVESYKFEYISFPKQRLAFGPIGLPSLSEVTLIAGSNQRTINLVNK